MKKQGIVNLMNLMNIRIELEQLLSVKYYEGIYGRDFINMDNESIEYEFKISNNEIQKELDIIKKEILEKKEVYNKITQLLKKQACPHHIRLKYPYSDLGGGTYTKCVLCNKKIDSDNINYSNTIYKDINKNKYCVTFWGSYEDEDFGFVKGLELGDIYVYINKILEEKTNDENIDLVQEFKKLNLEKATINEEKFIKEYYVLIIGGSNKEKINEQAIIIKETNDVSVDIAYYFDGIPRTTIKLLDSEEHFITKKFKEYFSSYNNRNIIKYTSIETLEQELEKEKNCPFDLIINVSSIFDYEIRENNIEFIDHDLELKKKFPNSYIVNFKEIKNNAERQILELIKNELKKYDEIYAFKNKEKIYELEDELKEISLEHVCEKIKKKIKK